ncbi:hypothetical protein CC86DRAFT_372478 [Ophiobolus disseminans]|uniref:Uncharacterized protein n=1 Tax=Ophiobolus disseminans TaxID=1469910 RepID=A0A6A6ZRU2_9PLEO|nr:hypothetical protein CC86DRAFT_372478 [Ophiobolus disseminans]
MCIIYRAETRIVRHSGPRDVHAVQRLVLFLQLTASALWASPRSTRWRVYQATRADDRNLESPPSSNPLINIVCNARDHVCFRPR